MASQFSKRKAKSSEDLVKEVEEKLEELKAPAAEETTYTQTGLNVYTPDGGSTYEVAEIKFNPETKQAEVAEIYKISRLVALQHANTQNALNTLKRKLIVKGK
jgi:hypothetical protein